MLPQLNGLGTSRAVPKNGAQGVLRRCAAWGLGMGRDAGRHHRGREMILLATEILTVSWNSIWPLRKELAVIQQGRSTDAGKKPTSFLTM